MTGRSGAPFPLALPRAPAFPALHPVASPRVHKRMQYAVNHVRPESLKTKEEMRERVEKIFDAPPIFTLCLLLSSLSLFRAFCSFRPSLSPSLLACDAPLRPAVPMRLLDSETGKMSHGSDFSCPARGCAATKPLTTTPPFTCLAQSPSSLYPASLPAGSQCPTVLRLNTSRPHPLSPPQVLHRAHSRQRVRRVRVPARCH